MTTTNEAQERVKRLRERTGLNQAMFAQAIDVAPHTLHKWETGERPTPHLISRLDRIESALNDLQYNDWRNLVGMNRKGNALNVRIRTDHDLATVQVGRLYDGLFVPEGEITLPRDLLVSAIAQATSS